MSLFLSSFWSLLFAFGHQLIIGVQGKKVAKFGFKDEFL